MTNPPYLPSVAVEGAVARFEGKPIVPNPYNPANNWHAWCSWRYGWDYARQLQKINALRKQNEEDDRDKEEAA